MKGISYLKTKLNRKRSRVLLRYSYYNLKHMPAELNNEEATKFALLREQLGWAKTAVDSLADRIVFDGFKNDNFDMSGIYNLNNPDILFDSAIHEALIGSCSFIYIMADENGFPKLKVLSAADATGVIDTSTGLLEEGYAVLKRDDNDRVLLEAYFVAGRTDYNDIEHGEKYSVDSSAPYPLLVPIINRPDAARPFGHSRLSRASMSAIDGAQRTVKRSEISAEFYSYPQKYVLGLSQDAEIMDKWSASMSTMMSFTKDDDGDRPTVGQFQQQSMEPHLSQLKSFASTFAGETGLTLDDLGFPTDNPSSAEAIKAAHENLRLAARKAQRTFGSGFVNAGYLAACVRDDYPYQREVVYETEVKWQPIFEPDAAMLSGIGDGAIKINQALPGYLDKEAIESLTGIKGGDIDETTIEE